MLFGHNTNLTVEGATYHVQTEDRGAASALMDTTVFSQGRVMHRLTNNYHDLLPLDPDREQALKLRLDDQHRSVVEQIRSGALRFSPSAATKAHHPAPASGIPVTHQPAPPQKMLKLELLNARTWLSGKHAMLQVVVRNETGAPAKNARVTARIDGSAEPSQFSTETNPYGQAQLDFEMPKLAASDPALVIDAVEGDEHGHLRFQLKTKQRIPSAG